MAGNGGSWAPSAFILLFISCWPFFLSGRSSSMKNSNFVVRKRGMDIKWEGGIGHKKKEQVDRQENMDTVISLPGLFLGLAWGGWDDDAGGRGGQK
jgi:hypothetical protein